MELRTTLAAAALIAALSGAAPAAAAEPVHPEISAMLETVPGGTATDYYNAYWPSLDMTMSVPDPMLRSVGTCSTGSICAFTGASMTGTKLSWGTCSTNTISGTFLTKSMANARSAGSVAQARNGTTIIASASAGSWAAVSGTVTNIRCLE